MSEFRYDLEKANAGIKRLAKVERAGSGIILGVTTSGSHLIRLAWLEARDEEQGRRRLEAAKDQYSSYVATVLYDGSGQEIRRHATMRSVGMRASGMRAVHHVVTTSDKTDLAAGHLAHRYDLKDTSAISTEDDAPLYTPRVTGALSLPKRSPNDRTPQPVYRFVGKQRGVETTTPYRGRPIRGLVATDIQPGVGLCAHQYDGLDETGELPRLFEGPMYAVPLGATAEKIATYYAEEILNPERLVAIVAQATNIASGHNGAPFIINRDW